MVSSNGKSMSNNWFEFKQFIVYQDRAAMKVGTDGVLIGAWAQADAPQRVLDIGCGTGLIALMVAQRWPEARIDAIDSDQNAYNQSRANFENSCWSQRLTAHLVKLQEFESEQSYDLIISNPPYFVNSLKNSDSSKSAARHTDSLSHAELLEHAARLLSDIGRFALILPADLKTELLRESQQVGLWAHRVTDVLDREDRNPIRIMVEFRKYICSQPIVDRLIIRDLTSNDYTEQYKSLTRDFYLKF